MTDAWRHDELVGWEPPRAEDLWPVPRVTNALGIDVSSHQPTIDWSQVVASGRSFCYIKSSESNNYVNPLLDAQYQGAKSAGVQRGLYHFADTTQTPEANADAFAAQVNRLGAVSGHLPPCLDLETGTGDLSGWAQRFITRLRADTGCVRVMVYSDVSFLKANIGGESWMDSNIALWVASPSNPPGQPAYMSPRVAIHQYATGQVAGVAGAVDLNYAIWPISTLIPGSAAVTTPNPSGLSADQDSKLTATYQQLSGSPTAGQWPGWPSWQGGSGRSLTLVDYARQADTQLCAIKAELDSVKAELDALKSAIDPAQIAAAVAAQLAAKLAS